jgi:Protein of unknown function (DUF1116)
VSSTVGTNPADLKARVEAANQVAVGRLVAADPVLVDVAPAGEVVEGLSGMMILHSGPPIAWADMCGAQRGSVLGLVLFEGWAGDITEAERLVVSGAVRLEPNHHHHGVGPMAGTTSPSLPVWVVENAAFGNRAWCRPTDAAQQFGDYSDEALAGIRHWRDVRAPAVRAAVQTRDGLPLKPLLIQALAMGDELHNRPNAFSSLIANALAPALVEANVPRDELLATLNWLGHDPFLGLALSMASAKSAAEPAEGVDYSTLVTTMARNGTEFGIRVSGLSGAWFTAPSPAVEGLFLAGYSAADAGLDMGDSAITETVGWGGFVLGGAPGILALVGGTPEQALQISRDMRQITLTESPDYRMPVFGFAGSAVGIDIRKVVGTGITPTIDTAIAHREPGHPKIGGGLVHAPFDCFAGALRAFGARYHS